MVLENSVLLFFRITDQMKGCGEMYIRAKAPSVVWKFGIALCGAVGITYLLGVFNGQCNLSMFRYYTNLSNLLCVLYFAADAVYLLARRRPGAPQNLCPTLKGIVMMGITVTWLVAHFMLGSFQMGTNMRLAVRLVHYVVPIMTILDWLLFDRKGQITLTAPLVWTAFPLIYFAYVMITAALRQGNGFGSSRYPYPFLNVDSLGLGKVLLTVLLMVLFFIALGYGFVLADHLLQRAGAALDKKRGRTDA